MAEFKGLQYKMAGNGSPQGRPRVYFTCHPQDFDKYFETICSEIFSVRQNIAIFYLEDCKDEMDEEETRAAFLEDLSSMQLFVVPITSKFLFDDEYKRAREIDFKYALEKHIPILPLMQEKGLERDFNRICGDLQFLDKNNSDETAIPYAEKFTKFLEAVLVGDELVEKIRAAFEAYIFLSYRKVDRAFAQKIMHLIHENPIYRDIAIWYDEFLTPGENFTESIKNAIEKSDLFAMVVTPNLLEDSNYVMKIEFPMAKEKGKDILPIVAVPTDPSELKDKYDGLPECIDSADRARLAEYLKERAAAIALSTDSSDPQHLFFIGLAYLGGIDVEVDRERALELITAAAEGNLVEAYEKLISMYESGDGVERDYYKAAEWRKKLAEYHGKHCRETKKYKDWKTYLTSLWNLGDAYFDLRMYEEAKKAYEEMKHAADVLVKNKHESDKRAYSVAHTKLANVATKMGDHATAKQLLEESLKYRVENEESDDAFKIRDLSLNYSKLSDSEMDLGHLEAAKEYLEKAIPLAEKAHKLAPENTLYTEDMATLYSKRAKLAAREGNWELERLYFSKALEIEEGVGLTADATRSQKRNLSVEYNNMGGVEKKAGNFEKAREYYLKALEIRLQIFDETPTIAAKNDLGVEYERLGVLEQEVGDYNAAKDYYLKEYDVFEWVLDQARTLEALRGMAIVTLKLGDLDNSCQKYESAKDYYVKSLEYREEMLGMANSISTRTDVASIKWTLGRVYTLLKQYDLAKQVLLEALSVRRTLYEETNLLSHQSGIATLYRALGEVYAAEEDGFEESEKYFRKGIEARELLLVEDSSVSERKNLSLIYSSLGNLYEKHKMYEEALKCFKRCYSIAESIYQDVKSMDALRSVAINTRQIAMNLRDTGNIEGAEEFFRKSIEQREKNFHEHPNTMTRKDLELIYKQVISFAKNNGKEEFAAELKYKLDRLIGNK